MTSHTTNSFWQRTLRDSIPRGSEMENKGSSSTLGNSQQPQRSFLFIVNELPTNDNPDIPGHVQQNRVNGRWRPPTEPAGFNEQVAGCVYRWSNGIVSIAVGYEWEPRAVGNPPYANGVVIRSGSGGRQPELFRAATVFYCNHFDNFFATVGDAATRNMSDGDPTEDWHPLTFWHGRNTVSYVDHAGDQAHVAVGQASWIQQLLPCAYRNHDSDGPTPGGLAGLLPLLIALVAFSCNTRADLWDVLITRQSWRDRSWVPHPLESGRKEHRGMVVSVFTDPENSNSTPAILLNLEEGEPIFN
ncbi:hypothetical protein PVAG01_04923 [Phlyctema vagabunda]|uniref:Uncharacterized protein n=1 Tax=Phlyctema vagabunda TaxID=108571 RepID=A0ABR4PIM5_9HELO